MSIRRISSRRFALPLVIIGLLVAGSASAQVYQAPTAPAASSGNYTVSYLPGCGYPPPGYYCLFTYLQERVEPGGAWTTVSSGTGSITFGSRAPGAYSYRVYAAGYDPYYNFYEAISPVVTVTVSAASVPVRDHIRAQMNYRYEVRQGDIDGNGRTDFLLRRTAGGTPANGAIGDVILRQAAAGGSFSALLPSAAQLQAASAWALSPVQPILSDINVDGYVDLTLSGVPAVVPGAVDQIVYAPGQPGRVEPLAVRSFGDRLLRFVSNTMDYFVDQDYYVNNAPMVYYETWYWYAWCNYYNYSGIGYDSWYQSYSVIANGCWYDYYYVSGVYLDYSGFSPEAVDLWQRDYSASNGQIDENQAIAEAESDIEELIGVPLGGWEIEELLGPDGEHRDPFTRRGIDIGQSVLGQARGGRNRTTSTLMPPQIPRVPDQIYITGHPLSFARSRGHLAVEYTASAGGVALPAETFSAAPERNNFFNYGKLIASTNRPTDDPLLNFYVGDVDPRWVSNAEYWQNRLKMRHHNYIAVPYAQKPDYAILPSAAIFTHNSNSYIAGLVSDSPSNAIVTVPGAMWARYPGWAHPVPDTLFR